MITRARLYRFACEEQSPQFLRNDQWNPPDFQKRTPLSTYAISRADDEPEP